MSSPHSSLNKHRKTPLGNRRSVPFRNPDITDIIRAQLDVNDEDLHLLDEVSSNMAHSRLSRNRPLDPITGGISRNTHNTSRTGSVPPTDMDLMSTMMSRISQLELRLQFQDKEISDKDKKIRVAEEKIKLLQIQKESDTQIEDSKFLALEKDHKRLQRQIQQMEIFLADYGMIWVGEDSDSGEEDDDDHSVNTNTIDEENTSDEETHESKGVWKPDASVPKEINYDLIIENIKDLNVLAGDGQSKIEHRIDGARLKAMDPINLTLYANGILMFNGPFRSFSEPSTQQCIHDLEDGYFPSELQSRYPDGIPFDVKDLRSVYFKDKQVVNVFSGSGQMLGGDHKPSKLIPTNLDEKSTSMNEWTSELPGPRLSREQFLERLPASVIKNGKIIDIRTSVSDTLNGGIKSCGPVTLLQTKTLTDLRKSIQSGRPMSSQSDVATLRIKSESGDETFVLRMRFHEKVGDIRKYLDEHRCNGTANMNTSYDIVSSFPKKVFTNSDDTLDEAGLTPNATLHLKPR